MRGGDPGAVGNDPDVPLKGKGGLHEARSPVPSPSSGTGAKGPLRGRGRPRLCFRGFSENRFYKLYEKSFPETSIYCGSI